MYDANKEIKSPKSTFKTGKIELWWDKKIAVQPAVECNRPDIVFWELEMKKCLIIDICVPMDVNVKREEKEKSDKYMILASRLQRLYPQYKYEIIPKVVGSTGYIPKGPYIKDVRPTRGRGGRRKPDIYCYLLRNSIV